MRGDIDRGNGGIWPSGSEGEGDHPATGADIENPRGWALCENEFAELFGLGSGDQCSGIAGESATMKFGGSEQMLEGFTGGPTADEISKGLEFMISERAIKFEIDFHTLFLQAMGEKILDI